MQTKLFPLADQGGFPESFALLLSILAQIFNFVKRFTPFPYLSFSVITLIVINHISMT